MLYQLHDVYLGYTIINCDRFHPTLKYCICNCPTWRLDDTLPLHDVQFQCFPLQQWIPPCTPALGVMLFSCGGVRRCLAAFTSTPFSPGTWDTTADIIFITHILTSFSLPAQTYCKCHETMQWDKYYALKLYHVFSTGLRHGHLMLRLGPSTSREPRKCNCQVTYALSDVTGDLKLPTAQRFY